MSRLSSSLCLSQASLSLPSHAAGMGAGIKLAQLGGEWSMQSLMDDPPQPMCGCPANNSAERHGAYHDVSSRREPQGYGCFVQPSCRIQPVIICLVSGDQPSSGAFVAIICLLVSP